MKANDLLELAGKQNSWAHAYLLIGKNKSKTEELINYIVERKHCLEIDVSKVSPEESSGKRGEIKKEQIKELLHTVNLSPAGECRIAVIYNCERLNQASGNILLKTLEEPPKYLTFILSAESDSVLSTIKSRCQTLRITAEEMEIPDQERYTQFLSGGFTEASHEIEKIVKNNEISGFLDGLLDNLRTRLLKEKKSGLAHGISEIERIRQEIAGNANPRLALESLYLILEKIK